MERGSLARARTWVDCPRARPPGWGGEFSRAHLGGPSHLGVQFSPTWVCNGRPPGWSKCTRRHDGARDRDERHRNFESRFFAAARDTLRALRCADASPPSPPPPRAATLPEAGKSEIFAPELPPGGGPLPLPRASTGALPHCTPGWTGLGRAHLGGLSAPTWVDCPRPPGWTFEIISPPFARIAD